MTIDELTICFTGLEAFAEKESDDAEKQVAACLLNGRIIETNTFVRGAVGLPNTRPDKYEFIIHAEANLVYSAAKFGIPLNNEVVVCTLSPCQNCIRTMFQAGIREIYYKETYRAHNPNMRDIKVTEESFGPYVKMRLDNHG